MLLHRMGVKPSFPRRYRSKVDTDDKYRCDDFGMGREGAWIVLPKKPLAHRLTVGPSAWETLGRLGRMWALLSMAENGCVLTGVGDVVLLGCTPSSFY